MKRTSPTDSPPKIDIRHVAKRARVSIATVSRTINHLPSVDPVLADRVWKAVADLNYRPNTQARALVSGRSRLLGLIISDITNPFFPEIVQQFEEFAVSRGYEILIGSTSEDPKKIEACARRMLERKVDGIALATFANEELLLDRLTKEHVPLVVIDAASKSRRSTTLSIDYQHGIHEAVQHLAVLGHRKIAFISGPLHLRSAQARRMSFLSCLRDAGLTANPDWLIEGDHTLDGGRDAMEKILVMRERPTAIMCSNDMTAIGVQHALFEADLKVPEDFSLIGFDDVHLAEYTIPPLTTIRMSCRDIARSAVASLVFHLQPDDPVPNQAVQIATRLIVRRTTGLPKNALRDLHPASARGSSGRPRGKRD